MRSVPRGAPAGGAAAAPRARTACRWALVGSTARSIGSEGSTRPAHRRAAAPARVPGGRRGVVPPEPERCRARRAAPALGAGAEGPRSTSTSCRCSAPGRRTARRVPIRAAASSTWCATTTTSAMRRRRYQAANEAADAHARSLEQRFIKRRAVDQLLTEVRRFGAPTAPASSTYQEGCALPREAAQLRRLDPAGGRALPPAAMTALSGMGGRVQRAVVASASSDSEPGYAHGEDQASGRRRGSSRSRSADGSTRGRSLTSG